MKKLILASVSAVALMGLAACSDTDDTTTQALPDNEAPMDAPMAQPEEPAEPAPPPAARRWARG